MATFDDLAPRVLRKLTVLPPGEDGDAADLETVTQKLQAVHASLKKDDLLRWTANDIPDFAEEPYVAMAAYLAGPEFTKAVTVDQWAYGHTEIEKAVQLKSSGTVSAEYF